MEYMVCSWWLWIQGPARVVTKGHKVLRVYHGIGPYINRPEAPPPMEGGGSLTATDRPTAHSSMRRWSVPRADGPSLLVTPWSGVRQRDLIFGWLNIGQMYRVNSNIVYIKLFVCVHVLRICLYFLFHGEFTKEPYGDRTYIHYKINHSIEHRILSLELHVELTRWIHL